jgi:aminodeoxyfutalosine synthase
MTKTDLTTISQKISRHERLSDSDALWLFERAPLAELGLLANQVNLNKNGRSVFYNVNRHINPTNICALSCKFCAYSKKIGEPGGYAYEIDEMITKAGEAISQGATELHMVGGLHPRWGFQRYVDMISAMRKAYPTVHLKAFTAVELDWMARKARKSIEDVIIELREAGLNSFPGGGAEIFHPEIRDQICDTKVSGEQWIDTHRTAHRLGMRSNCTMLYGHIERFEHRVDHMRRLRDLQDETSGFNVFIPLAFQPFQNEMNINRYTFGADDLRTIAVARLYLDNFKNIKSYWVMLGQDIAQVALNFGANDLDGTVLEEKISRAAGGQSGMIMTRPNLEELIRRGNRIPVERTTLYEPIHNEDRIHLQPIATESSEESADLLRKILDRDLLTANETWNLAQSSPFIQIANALTEFKRLGHSNNTPPALQEGLLIDGRAVLSASSPDDYLNQLIHDAKANCVSYSEHFNKSVYLDSSQVPPEQFEPLLTKIYSKFPWISMIVQDSETFRSCIKTSGLKYVEFLASLRRFGVAGIEANWNSDDGEITQNTTELLANAITADLKVSVSLCLFGDLKGPNWERFSVDLISLRSAAARCSQLIAVNFIANQKFGRVMPLEFLKALALARLSLGDAAFINIRADGIPSLAPTQGIGANTSHNPALKLVSLLYAFGANGVGSLWPTALNSKGLLEDLRAASNQVSVLNKNGHPLDIDDHEVARLSTLRHVPPSLGVSGSL